MSRSYTFEFCVVVIWIGFVALVVGRHFDARLDAICEAVQCEESEP